MSEENIRIDDEQRAGQEPESAEELDPEGLEEVTGGHEELAKKGE